jgi:hypothetical protein
MKNLNLTLTFFSIVLMASCSSYRNLAEIKMGGEKKDTIIIKKEVIQATNGPTYLTYKDENQLVKEESNVIEYKVVSKQKAENIPVAKVKMEKNNNAYAYATVNKYFYKSKPWRPLVFVAGAVALVPTFGASSVFLFGGVKPYELNTYSTDVLKTPNLKGYSVDKKVVVDVKVYCKRKLINDTITVTDNIPSGSTMLSYKIKSKKGNKPVVIHEKTMNNGVETHTYKIVGKRGYFNKRKSRIWIFQDLRLAGFENYSSPNN